MIIIYTDGSTKGENKKGADNCGGWAFVVLENEKYLSHKSELSTNTTNNREELKAVLGAMKEATTSYKDDEVLILSDSAYVVRMINEWIDNWALKGWARKDNQPIENLDLVKQIYNYTCFPQNFTVKKVKGHNGEWGNELADALATNNKSKIEKLFKEINANEITNTND